MKEQIPFVPYVQKGRLGDEEGYLVKYDDLCKALRVPEDHWVTEIDDSDPGITITLVPKSVAKARNGITRVQEHKETHTIRNKEVITDRCGIIFDYFDAVILLRTQGNEYFYLSVIPSSIFLQERKHVYFWFTQRESCFVEKIELPRELLRRRNS